MGKSVATNEYATVWRIIEWCSKASVLAESLLRDPTTASLAGAAALSAAERIGISDEDIDALLQRMAKDIGAVRKRRAPNKILADAPAARRASAPTANTPV